MKNTFRKYSAPLKISTHLFLLTSPIKIEKVQVPPFYQHWKFFRPPCRKGRGKTLCSDCHLRPNYNPKMFVPYVVFVSKAQVTLAFWFLICLGGFTKKWEFCNVDYNKAFLFHYTPTNFTCSKSAIKTLERGVKYIQS